MVRLKTIPSILTALILILPSFDGAGQGLKTYKIAPINKTVPPYYLLKLQEKLKRDKIVALGDRRVKESIHSLLDQRSQYVIQLFNDGYFIVDNEMTSYLQDLQSTIYKSNPQLPNETNIFALRKDSPNAISFGDGTIALTLGLLSRLENEDQILFVLCHELAHYHSKHSNNKIEEIARIQNDKNYKKQVKEINRSEYGQFTKYSKLINSLQLSLSMHGREKEFEADSLALQYFLNVSMNSQAPIRTLEILDSADMSLFKQNLNFKAHFNFTKYPFKDQWLNYKPSYSWHVADNALHADSLRTHPSCSKRIEALRRQLTHPIKQIDSRKTEMKPNVFREASIIEMIESEFYFEHYGMALYTSLSVLEKYEDTTYLHSMIGKCLYQLYIHQKNHELGNVLSLPDSRFPESYDRFLTFVHSLRLQELASLTYYYMADRKQNYLDNEDFIYSYWLATQTGVGPENPELIKASYLSRFPNGKYVNNFR
jgi:Zn-dependent protease with chaperone function